MGTSIFLILVSCIITILPLATAQFCLNQFNFTANSTFPEARNVLLSSLAVNVTARGGFFTDTRPLDSDDTLYGLGLCNGDLLNETCFNCISAASQAVIDNCTNHKEAVALWDHCMVRYSNRSFFDVMDTRPAVFGWATNNISANYVNKFDVVLSALVDRLIGRAATGYSPLKFATGDDNYSEFDNRIYALVQCVPTLSSGDCNNCLRGALVDYTSCCLLRTYVNIWSPSCSFRYQLSPFLESPVGAAPPPPPSPVTLVLPPPPSTNATGKPPPPPSQVTLSQEGKDDNTTRTVILIVVPTAIFVMALIVCTCIILRNRKQRKPRQRTESLEDSSELSTVASLQYDFDIICVATNNFSDANMLGRGGFGAVYRAWKKWRQGKASRLIDQTLRGGSESEKMRCIHIGLLCVQENVVKRPTMASVALMLNSFSMSLPVPSKPAFLMQSSVVANTAIPEKFSSRVTSSDQSLEHTSPDQSLEFSVNPSVNNEDSITLPR